MSSVKLQAGSYEGKDGNGFLSAFRKQLTSG